MAIALAGTFVADAQEQETPPQTVSALIDASPVVTISRSPADQSVVAVYSEREPQWSGNLAVYHRTGDTIDWPFTFPKSYEEHRGHYVVRFRWITLRQSEHPVLEVVESTHMGNGSLRLFEIEGRKLRLLLDTVVRGRFRNPPAAFGVREHAEAYFVGPHLNVEYQSRSDQTADSILLTGSVRIEDMAGKESPPRGFAQTCAWDDARRVFIAQPATSP
ncbi:MAG: hypothetical protein EOP86_24295 [Verrucomicrobiaceae bacterium]|nr:MAG: hypothetical protein EOP86_24295 [Verrucomicrobiaceae bacterium]